MNGTDLLNVDRAIRQIMPKHTPGPWETVGGLGVYTQDQPGKPVRQIVHNTKGADREEARANARLIAAAPEMLDLLRSIISHEDRNFITRSENAQARELIARIAEK